MSQKFKLENYITETNNETHVRLDGGKYKI